MLQVVRIHKDGAEAEEQREEGEEEGDRADALHPQTLHHLLIDKMLSPPMLANQRKV